MPRSSPPSGTGDGLTPEVLRRMEVLFPPEEHKSARDLLEEVCTFHIGSREVERCRIAALKLSDGKLPALQRAVRLARRDFRDLLMAAGFGHDVNAHKSWEPMPADAPAQVDPLRLAAVIEDRLAELLTPLGFSRTGDTWRREGAVLQTLQLQTGLTSRIQTRFFVRATVDAKPRKVLLHLPKLPPNPMEVGEQGYIFRAGDNEQALCSSLIEDVRLHALPLFARFITHEEVQQGLRDGTFKRHMPVDGQIFLF